MQVAQRNQGDVVRADPHRLEGHLEGVAVAGQQLGVDVAVAAMEPVAKKRVTDERHVEPGVEQQPAAIDLNQDTGHRLAVSTRRVTAADRDRLRQVLPSEGQGDQSVHARHAPAPGRTDTCADSTRQPVRLRIQAWVCRPVAAASSNSAVTTAMSVPTDVTS